MARIQLIGIFIIVFAAKGLAASFTPIELNGGMQGRCLLPDIIQSEAFSLYVDIDCISYPLGTVNNPVYEVSLVEPVRTSKMRFACNDASVHVTEIRLYGPETTEYPPAMWGRTVGIEAPNLATHAVLTASSEYEGRPKEGVNDGLMTFESRWYSGSASPPHWLIFDLGMDKEVDHIQMVSGYHSKGSVDWQSIARNFHFEYWQDGQWKKVRTSENKLQQPGGFALKLEGSKGSNLVFLHDNSQSQRFAMGSYEKGKLKVIEPYAPQIVEEPQKGIRSRIEIKRVGPWIYMFCNGRKTGVFDIQKHGITLNNPIRATVQVLSVDTALKVMDFGCEFSEQGTAELLGEVVVTDVQNNEVVPSDFDPFCSQILARLPRMSDRVTVDLNAVPGAEISVNGVKTRRLVLEREGIHRADPITIDVRAQNNHKKSYTLNLTPVPPAGRLTLAYEDTFEGVQLNLEDWIYRRGLRWESLNTPEAVSVGGGMLRISLSVRDGQQLVGGIISKKAFGYGYYETRAKLTEAKGWHSAFWNHGLSGGMPEMGTAAPEMTGNYTEIDCFESTTPDAFTTNLHHNAHGIAGTGRMFRAKVAEAFHTYAWLWTPEEVCYYFDGQLIDRRVNYPPTRPQNVWLTCVAHPGAETDILPQEILFDYFRYYRYDSPPDTLPENALIIGTDSPGYREQGTWISAADDMAQSYRLGTTTRKTVTAGSSCEWTCTLPAGGFYEVYVWNPYIVIDPVINRRTYEIGTADGTRQTSYNPRIAGQKWISLGVYQFGKTASVSLRADSNEIHRADALAFLPIQRQ